METNQKPWKTMKPPWKTMETNENHETTLKNHKNQPKTMKNQPNWPPLIQKRDRYQQGDPTDHLWSKNVTVTNREIQQTTFDPKTLPLPTRGPTDLLDV